jgi:hypothetical protein
MARHPIEVRRVPTLDVTTDGFWVLVRYPERAHREIRVNSARRFKRPTTEWSFALEVA